MAHAQIRLIIVGEGNSRQACIELLREAGAEALAWLPGERADVPELMRAMDLFVLPSLGEGISNTILEAMSTGLPVVATRVGGNEELVKEDITGTLVPPDEPAALTKAILEYYRNPDLLVDHGRAGASTYRNGLQHRGHDSRLYPGLRQSSGRIEEMKKEDNRMCGIVGAI